MLLRNQLEDINILPLPTTNPCRVRTALRDGKPNTNKIANDQPQTHYSQASGIHSRTNAGLLNTVSQS